MNKTRNISLDLMRIISTLFVVIIHVTSVGMNDMELGSSAWTLSVGINSLSRWAVPLFFMISGALFLNPEKEITAKKIWTHNIPRIALWIVVGGLLYSLLDQYIFGTLSVKSIILAVYAVVTDNGGYHLWFLYVLLMLYIGTPIFRLITKNATKKQLQYILIVWFIVSICFGHINDLANEIFGIKELLPFEAFPIAGYAGYFLLGDYLKRFPIKKTFITVLLGIGSLLVSPILAILISKHTGERTITAFISPMSIASCLIAIFVFTLISKIETTSPKFEKVTVFFSKNSFGVYLFHVFWISLIFRILKLDYCMFGTVASIPIWIVAISTLSVLTAWILRLIPGIKKVL